MKKIPASVLDLAVTQNGASLSRVLSDMTALARRAEELGYRRFWVAEHHGTPFYSSAAPPVILAGLVSATSAIRLGSGGVMLPNHSPLVVAEQFGTLSAMAPGRIDLGMGRGPGAIDLDTVTALRRGAPGVTEEEYAQQVRDVLGIFARDPLRSLRVPAVDGSPVELWLLASSASSARLAAQLGLPLSFAGHIRPENLVSAVSTYRREFKPSNLLDRPYVQLGLQIVCAETDERAAALARPNEVLRAQIVTGKYRKHPTVREAGLFEFDLQEEATVEKSRVYRVQGAPDTVREKLAALTGETRPDELMIFTPIPDVADRVRSYELLAEHVLDLS